MGTSMMMMMMMNVPITLCDPPHRVGRPEQVEALAADFRREGGWRRGAPTLVGYPLNGRVQLLSGSHRYAAALVAGLACLPVRVVPLAMVQEAWGDLNAWQEVMHA